MKTAIVLASLMAALAISAQALSISDITVTGTNSASGAVTVGATISGASASGAMATYQATSADGLARRYFHPTLVSGTSWSSSEWIPYFTGTFIIDITAFDNNHMSPPVAASTTVTVTRVISGTVNGIKYSTVPYNATNVWNNVDTSAVKLHDIGLRDEPGGVGSVGCNLLNANPGDTSQMSEEQRDIAYTDTGSYKPAGTPYRFDVSLHARPRGFMGMGEIKRWIWTPYDTNSPDGSGILVVDITAVSPWRSSYSNALQSHVGFVPLFAPPDFTAMPTGMIMCTSAHYMDVGPTNTGTQTETRAGLRVNGHTGTNSYLKMFISDTVLQHQFGLTNVYDATNMLAGFVQHFDTNGAPIDTSAEVTASFIRIEGGTNNILYDYNSDGIGDSGYEVRFDFEFHSAVAAMMGRSVGPLSVEGDIDGDRLADPYWPIKNNIPGQWTFWLSSGGYLPSGPYTMTVPGGEPVRVADFDGDGLADPVMVANGGWTLWLSSGGYLPWGPYIFTVPGGEPVAGDFDGDRLADPVMVANGGWTLWLSSGGYLPWGPYIFAVPGTDVTPVAGDFDGDRLADPVMVANGGWTFWFSSGGYLPSGPYVMSVAGTDVMPMTGDFDGDGLADPAMVVNHNWTLWLSSGGYLPSGPYVFIP